MAALVGYCFDENDNITQSYYQAYHYQTNNWSDIRQTDVDGYYSRDTEDTDFDGNGIVFPAGDIILLVFWSNGIDKSGLKDRMSIHKIISDNSSAYNIDVQLLPKTSPTCTWTVNNIGTINNQITSSQQSSDVYQWIWNNKTFLHDNYYYGQNIFDSVGNLTHLYAWDAQQGYNTINSYTYLNIGDYVPKHKVENSYGLVSICEKDIRIRYNTPSGYFNFDKNSYNLYDDMTVTLVGTDIDTRIQSIEHYFNNILKVTNTNLNYTYIETLNNKIQYDIKATMYWDDGFNLVNFDIIDTIYLDNVAPELDLIISNIDNTYTFNAQPTDLEDEISSVQYKIYLCSTAIFEEAPASCNWSLLDTIDITVTDWKANATFYKGGKFKVTAQVQDEDGAYSILDEIEFDVTITESVVGYNQNNNFFDWE